MYFLLFVHTLFSIRCSSLFPLRGILVHSSRTCLNVTYFSHTLSDGCVSPFSVLTALLLLLLQVKEESEKVGLNLNIQKTKIMASGPITSWQIDGETVETVSDFFWGGLQNHFRW